MKKLDDMADFMTGSPQFRITETSDKGAPVYTFYSQTDFMNDAAGIISDIPRNKQVCTFDYVSTLQPGDLIFSLITGKASIVHSEHAGYLFTQNYIKIVPNKDLEVKFLAYLLNENHGIKKHLFIGLQGSQVLKYTLMQLRALEIGKIPSKKKQKLIGQIYFDQIHLQAVKNQAAELETILVLSKLEGTCK